MTVTRQDVLRHAPGNEPTVADGMEHKTTRAQPNAGDVLSIDEAQGLVTAIVSVTGIEDSVKDVIHPGSYADTLANRRPKVVQHHDWKQAVARVEDVKELPPGHPDLPEKTGDGKPWPSAAGALVTTMRYNLKTAAGRDAFETVKFYSESHECEWSIGYRVPSGKSTRAKDGVRQIKAIDLYEISFVLFGAAPGTGTLAVKSSAPDSETGEGAAAAAAEDEAPVPSPSTAPDDTGVSSPDDVPAEDVDADGGGRDDGSPGDPDAEPAPNPGHVDWDALDRAADRLTETAPGDGGGGEGEGDEGEVEGEGNEVPDAAPAQETPAEDAEVDEKALAVQPVYDADIKRAFSSQTRREHAKRGTALPGGSFPIVNIADLKNAIKAYGRAKSEDREKVKRHIIARARALNATNLLPDGWNTAKPAAKPFGKKDDGADDALTDAYEAADDTKMAHISLDRSPRKNWVENAGQLPAYIQHIAKDLHTKRGMPLERAIPTAIAAVKRWAAGGGNVNPDTRAKATKALAEWEALKAKNAARHAAKHTYDPALEVGPYAGTREAEEVIESVAYPHLPGTFEEIRARLAKALGGGVTPGRNGAPLLTVDATWHDRTIVTWFPLGDAKAATSYEVPYRVDSDGQVWLGEPAEVKLTASTGGDAPLPQTPVIEALTDELRTGLLHEAKAGRVLSTSNANHLRGAVEQLIAVLEAAGIKIAVRDSTLEDAERNAEPVIVPDSTAPSAQPDEMVKVDPLLRARALKVFAAINDG